ncbi:MULTISPECIES: PoNi-like cognate immunity protein [Pseudomonas]|uniref:PoNi-like cognate immunity protein n=1 Tax=Pseudomonas TaxID=286 RepID=UPI001687EB1B|nr:MULTISPECIES: PoNi-like cognate immunity protein [Pseudomonas]MDD2005708.1 PoNi-like cognate immunity protein [Pseudomonas putida]MDH0705784.1 PoNi-like cognate immunity protein [Pseudomonas sp. GD03862]QNV68432.1 DUF1911 domain-containing protein [Pseudomonas sp. CFA]HEN8705016.1 DUF1911 domain-containing protein [Pseudomonas putida]
MDPFDSIKRDPWMVEQHCHASTREKEQEFADPDTQALLAESAERKHHYRGLSRDWAHMALELAIQRYSGGEPMELVEAYVDYAFAQFTRHFTASPTTCEQLRPWVADEYRVALWLLSLAVLCGYPDRVGQVLGWLNQDDERSPDLLLHRLFLRLGKAYPGTSLLHPETYAALLESLDLRGQAQHEALLRYLERWYAKAHVCYWHERHARARGDHLGYWAFEAAMVAFLWSVPGDALESAPHFFPKALIARAHYRRLGKQFRDPETVRREDAPGWPSGTPCPWPGHYTCVERSVGEQVFMHQTPFPKIDGQVVHWRLSRTF